MLWLLYIYTIADNLKALFAFSILFIGLSFVTLVVVWLCHGVESWHQEKEILDRANTRSTISAWLKPSGVLLVILALLQTITPDSKGIAILAGGAFASSVVQSQEAKDVGSKVITLLNQQLDEHIKPEATQK